MRLLRLEASGFKSFCDKTIINFVQNGISIVVGPNGCGKSNIVDAIRWTLGEQSAKHLRGGSMEDVIFSGSSTRQPVSVAQVTLVFTNPESDTIPRYAEFTEISVTRRLYRSGESQYLINKTPCRLTDIRELFMDTGIGGKGYSIIEQGKIDQIITSRAEDRRMIIDEAAGIVKFKTKRKEAERKFEATKQNLLRVEDVLAELKRQEETLVVQVERAEEYLTAKSRLERLQNCISAKKWHKLKEQADRVTKKRDDATRQRNDLKVQISSLEAKESALNLEITKDRAELEEYKRSIQEKKEEVIKLESKLESDKITLENLDEWEKKNSEEIDLIDKQIKTVEYQLQTYQTENKSLNGEIDEKSRLLDQLNEVVQSGQSELSNQQVRLKNLQDKEVEAVKTAVGDKTQLDQLQERLKEVKEKTAQLSENQNDLTLEEEESLATWEKLSAELEKKRKKKEKLTETIESYSDQKDEKDELLNELKRKTASAKEEINRNENRVRSLEEIILSHEEYDNATRSILDFFKENEKQADKLGFLGSLVELAMLPEEIPPTAAAFLNRYFNLLVFQSVSKLEDIINLAGEESFEQFQLAFLDLQKQGANSADSSLNSLISINSEKNGSFPFIDHFETLDGPIYKLSKNALSKADGLIDSEATVMTRAGIFLVGKPGSANLAETLINRRNEIATLNQTNSDLTKQMRTLNDQLQEVSDTADEVSRLLMISKQDLVDLDLELVSLEKEFDNKSEEKQRIEKARENMSNEQIQLIQQRTQFEEKIKSLSQSITENEQTSETIRRVRRDLQGQIEKTESSLEESSNELQHLQVVLAGLKEKQQSNNSSLKRLNQDILDRKTQKEEIVKRSLETDGRREATHSSLKEAESRLPRMLEELSEMEKEQNSMSDRIEASRNQQMELAESIKKEIQTSSGLKEKDHKLEIRLAQLLQEAKNIEDNLFAEDSLKPEDLIRTFNVKEFNIEEETENINQLKKKIGGMEDINLAAKAEYETLKERLNFLDTQSSDLIQSMEALEASITKINQESRKRFKSTFIRVNEEFSKLFPQLFGGGEAYLRLTNEADLLESGVDIIAQPPGKKLQNMTLLSGGEKALTAIALIFAVFMIKPSPFCLLDEVDAPLDDANNVRFNKHVTVLTENSQFIIITHNKKTMEIGDALFGITMEEPGISKIVSVDFNSIDTDSLQTAI